MKNCETIWGVVFSALCLVGTASADTFWYFTGANADDAQNWFAPGNWDAGETAGTPTTDVPHSNGSPFDSLNLGPGAACVFDPATAYATTDFSFGAINVGVAASDVSATMALASGNMRLYYLVVGSAEGSTAAVTHTGGTWTYIGSSVDGALRLGAGAGSKGSFTLAGGTVVLEGSSPRVTIGLNGAGELTVADGDMTVLNELALGKNEGATGRLVMTGGTLTGRDHARVGHAGEIELRGGVLTLTRLFADEGATASLLMDGGTLAKAGTDDQPAFVSGFGGIQIGAAGATFEISAGQTELKDVLRNADGVEAPGAFVKTGDGMLVYPSGSTFTGPIHVRAGILKLPVDGTDYAGRLTVDEGAQVVFDQDLEGDVSPETVASLISFATAAGTQTLSFTVPAGKTATIASDVALAEGWSVVKSGEGLLRLTGHNTWTGDTTIQDGVLAARVGEGVPAGSLVRCTPGSFAPILAADEAYTGVSGVDFHEGTANGQYYGFSAVDNAVTLNFGGAGEMWETAPWMHLAFNRLLAQHPLTIVNRVRPHGIYPWAGETPETAVTFAGGINSDNGNGIYFQQGYTTVRDFFYMDANVVHQAMGTQVTFAGDPATARFDLADWHVDPAAGEAELVISEGLPVAFRGDLLMGNPDNGGKGVVRVRPGAAVTVGNRIVIGNSKAAQGLLEVDAATVALGNFDDARRTCTIGNSGIGQLTIVNGGSLAADSVQFGIWANGQGALEVRTGGELVTRNITSGKKPGAVTIDGGRLTAAPTAGEDFVVGSKLRGFSVGEGGATVAVAGADQTARMAVKGIFQAEGPLTKAGDGTLELDMFGFAKGLTVEGGTLKVLPGAGNASGSGALARRLSFASDLSDSAGGAAAVVEGTADARFVFDGNTVTLSGSSNYGAAGAIGIKFTDMPFFPMAESATFEMWWNSDWFPTKPFDLLCVGSDGSKIFRLVGEKGKAPYVFCAGANQGSGSLVACETKVPYYFGLTFGVNEKGESVISVYQYRADAHVLLGKLENLVVPGWSLANLPQTTAFINGSFWTGSTAKQTVRLDEVRVWRRCLTAAEMSASVANGPDMLPPVDVVGDISLGAQATLSLPEGLALNQPVTFGAGACVKLAGDADLSTATFAFGEGALAWFRSRPTPWDWTLVETEGGRLTKLPQVAPTVLKAARVRFELVDGATRLVLRPDFGTTVFMR